MKKLIYIIPFLFTACSTSPIIKTVDNIVEVPVATQCKIKSVDKPEMPTDNLKKTDNIKNKTVAALAEIERRKDYERQLEAAIKECQ